MTDEEKQMEIAALLITGFTAAGKLIIDAVAAAGARGEALYDLAVQGVASLSHQLGDRDPARFKAVFDNARATLKARFPRGDEPTVDLKRGVVATGPAEPIDDLK